VILAFDAPQTIRHILLEVEELEVARTQELQLESGTNRGLRGHLFGLTSVGLHTGIPALERGP
jgi:hypothetical protein